LKDNNSVIDLSFHTTEKASQLKSSKKSSNYERIEIDDRFDDIILRLDATQRAEASIHQLLSFLVREVLDLKRRQAGR
jgi:hypothetical protein